MCVYIHLHIFIPAIVWVLPEPVWPYMKTVEAPPRATLRSSGTTANSQSCVWDK